MAKVKISEFSANPANNTDIDGINIAENCPPSGINDAIRELMAQLKDFQAGTAGDSFNGPVGTTTAAAGAFTTLSASGAVTLSGGTANGVPYLNGSKVLTTGSALTFNGTNLVLGANKVIVKNAVGDAQGLQIYQAASDVSSIFNYYNGALAFGVNNAEQMRLTSTGLGIGTSSPTAKLDVRGNATFTGNGTSRQTADFTNTGGQLYVGAESSSGGAVFVGSSAYAGIVGTNTNTPLQLGTNGTIKATLDSSGNLGLGVTPSASTLPTIQSAYGVLSGNTNISIVRNAYYNGGWKYTATGAATFYQHDGGGHYWYNAPSGTAGNAISFTQAMSLDASGRLLLGTTTPLGAITSTNASGYIGLSTYTTGGSISEHTYVNAAGLQIDSYQSVSGSPYTKTTDIVANADSGASAQMRFFTTSAGSAPSERARIDSSGNLLVGTTSNPYTGRIVGYGAPFVSHSTGTTATDKFYFVNGNGIVGYIQTNGSSTSYNTSSDYRLKENVQPMAGALARVLALKPVTYTWKRDGSEGEGFIAHELQAVVPQCVTGEKDAVDAEGNPQYQGIDVSFLVGTLTAAIQELKAEFDAYKASHP